MVAVFTVIHIVLTIALIVLVLVQRGKGADIGAAFGSGASSTVFGSQGSASFLTRTTAVVATLFFVTSLTLAYLSGQRNEYKSVVDTVQPAASDKPAVDVPVMPSDKPQLPAQ